MNILKETQNYLNEVKGLSIKKGDIYTLSGNIGKFNKGDKVTINDIKPQGSDIELFMSNSEGIEDTFYLDKNDEFEELD